MKMEIQQNSSILPLAEAYFFQPLPNQNLSEDCAAQYVCRLCKKTFYNANALQNHKNMQHEVERSDSDEEHQPDMDTLGDDQRYNDVSDFKFIPRNKSYDVNEITTQTDGLTRRVFDEDTSYLLIKYEEDEVDIDAVKRRRLEGVVRRTQMKPIKQAVDLRGPFTCTFPSTLRPDLQCRQIFFNCCEYSLHYREEHTKRRKAALRCQVCEKRLDRDFYATNTMTPSHFLQSNKPLTFSCRACGQTFLDSKSYDEHNRIVHAKMKPHQCSICSKRFTQQGGLQQHMRMHTGIRPFACTFCPKAFTQKAGLDQHLRTHTKIKPFKCVICSKCFSQSVHLRQHMRTHTNIQPFECSLCRRRFKQSSHLNFHMRSHAGEPGAFLLEGYPELQPATMHDADGGGGMDFLNLASLQQVRDGDTLYYAAEFAAPPPMLNPCVYQPQIVMPDNVGTLGLTNT